MPEFKDWRGTPIEVGSIIVYPGRASSAIWMTEAEVVECFTRDLLRDVDDQVLKVRRIRDNYHSKPGTISYVTALKRVTVIG